MPEPDKIIKACQNGERRAQHELYKQYASKLFAVCIQYSKNRAEAEDFLHEGFIKIFEKIGQYRFQGSIEGWMRRIMVNTVLEGYRKNKHMVLADTSLMSSEPVEEQEDDGKDIGIKIQEALSLVNDLPERYKLVFNLYVLEEYTHQEIARHLGISVGTSKSNLARARQWIKNRLAGEETDKVKKLWQS